MINDNDDGLTRSQLETMFGRAFSLWQNVTDFNFSMSHSNEADIIISFEHRPHDDGIPIVLPFDKKVLAHAFYPLDNKDLAGDIHFNDDQHFTLGREGGTNIFWVAVHEIGHSLGLKHSKVRDAVMHKHYKEYPDGPIKLHEDDVNGINTLYGKYSVSQLGYLFG